MEKHYGDVIPASVGTQDPGPLPSAVADVRDMHSTAPRIQVYRRRKTLKNLKSHATNWMAKERLEKKQKLRRTR